MKRLFLIIGLLAATLGLAGCGEPPYSNVDNAQLKTLLAEGVPSTTSVGPRNGARPAWWREAGP
jgi:hypothetical protein